MITIRFRAFAWPAALLILALISAVSPANAQSGKWPERVVRIVVATPPGGGDDYVARLIAPKLSELLGQQFIVENRAGAGGVIGQTFAMKAPPDGYTWLLAGASMAGARYVSLAANFDVLRDFTAVSLLETSPFVMVVHPSVPARSVKEYIALARSQPGKMTYVTLGAGQAPYWNAHLFNNLAGIKALEVPYKAFGEALNDLMAGRVDYFFAPAATAVAQKARLRPLAVTTLARTPALPEVPTMAEAALPGYDMPAWRSIMGPANVRQDIVLSLNVALVRTLTTTDVQEKLRSVGSEPASSSPDQLVKLYADWIGIYGKIAKQAGIKPM